LALERTVPRRGPVERLLGARAGDLVTVTAPAGYGKTIALGLWDDADPRPFAWTSIDQLDDDPVHLLVHIAVAVAQVTDVDPSTMSYLRGPGRSPLHERVPAVLDVLESCGTVVVVVDDVHLLSTPAAIECLAAIVARAPASCTVALSGRSTPPVPVGRHRLAGRLTELGPDDLRLTDDEAAAIFAAVGAAPDSRTIREVVERCEGWAGGVHLAALALRDHSDTGVHVLPSGRHRFVADYLVEEVLHGLDPETTAFLEESSVLDRMCAEHLDELRGAGDSAAHLSAIEESGNLFLVPLDEERRWYRYHHLFGELLRSRLRANGEERHRDLASRASALLEREGDLDGALAQAVAAGDGRRAAALAARDALPLAWDGRAGLLQRRVALLDAVSANEYVDAAIARAWLGVASADATLIRASLVVAHRADDGSALADGTPSVTVATALVRAVIGVDGILEVLACCDVVRDAGDIATNPWWGVATAIKGSALVQMGETAEARRLLTAALPTVGSMPGLEAACLAYLALLDLDDGRLSDAARQADAARRVVDRHDLRDVVPAMVIYAIDAVVSARRNLRERSVDSAEIAATLLGRLGGLATRASLGGHVLLARSALALNDGATARRHLAAARSAAALEPLATGLIQRLEETEQQLSAGAMTSLLTPLTPAELRVLPHLATHLSLQEIGEALTLSRNTAKSHSVAIYRKLGVTSRAEAVAEARRLGLLDG
jgi:LuxR family maltose regulon positive regulatory protein